MLSKGMQSVQESLQAEYDEMYEHYQVVFPREDCVAWHPVFVENWVAEWSCAQATLIPY